MEDGWLEELESKVQAAVEKLKALRKENGELKKRLAAVENELDQANADASGAAEWRAQRANLRRRVEKLASTLEELVGSA